jgi:hypothetical protein
MYQERSRGRKVTRTRWIQGGKQRRMRYILKTEKNIYQEGGEGGNARDGYKVENREECDT